MSKDTFFVGREQEQRMYEGLLTRETSWVMLITGLPGIGKSTLLRHLTEQTKLKNIPVITLDFAQPWLQVDVLTILEELAEQVKSYCNKQPFLDQYEQFKKVLADGRKKFVDRNKVINRIVVDARGGHEEQEKQILQASAAYNEALKEVATVKNAFYDLVGAFNPNRLVIMFDSSEYLYKPAIAQASQVGRLVMEEFIPEFHKKHRHCSFVIASREPLQIGDVPEQEIIDRTLSPLGWAEVDKYLQREEVRIEDPKLRRQVYDITSGHPFYVALIGDFWRKQQEQEEHTFTIDKLHSVQDPDTNALLQDLGELILDPHSPLYFSDLDRYGVLLRAFNLPMAQAVFPEFFLKGREQEQFDQAVCAPYIVPREDRYTFHDLLREVRAPHVRVDKAEWDKYHKRALDYLEQFSPYPLDWYYHALAHDERRGLARWRKAVDQAYTDGNRTRLNALLLVAHDKALNLLPTTCAVLAYEQGRYYHSDRQWEEALGSYKRALDFYRDMHDYQGEAKVYTAIADVQRLRNDSDLNKGNNLKAALYYYKQAQAIYVQTKDPLYQAYMLQEIGEVQRLRAKWDAAHDKLDAARSKLDLALKSYGEALTFFQALGSVQNQVYLHRSMGDALAQYFRDNHNIQDRDTALEHYKQAEDLYQLEDNSSFLAHICKAEGDLYRARDDWDAALEKYNKAEELYKKVQDKDPLDQAYVCKAMGEIHQTRHQWNAALEKYKQALNLYIGMEDRSGQAAMYKAMGDVEWARSKWDDALKHYDDALKRYREIGDVEGVNSVYEAVGNVNRDRGDWPGALQMYRQTLDESEREPNYKKAAYAAQEAGKALRKLNEKETEKILDYFKKARNHYGEGDKAGQAYVYQLMGEVKQANNLAGADEDYEEARRLYEEVGKDTWWYSTRKRAGAYVGAAYMCQLIGKMKHAANKLDEALNSYEKALSFYQKALDLYPQVKSDYEYNALDYARDRAGAWVGAAYMSRVIGESKQTRKQAGGQKTPLDHYKDALDFYKWALDFYKQGVDSNEHSKEYSAEHCVRDRAGACVGAAEMCQLIAKVEQADNKPGTALQRYDDALGFYLQALSFYQQISDSYQQAGDEAKYSAEDWAKDYARASKGADHVYEVMSGSAMEQSHKNLGSALEHYDKALDYYKKMGDFMGSANVYRITGDALQDCKKWDDALKSYDDALKSYKEVLNRYQQAKASLSKSQEQENLAGQAYVYRARGDVLRARQGDGDLENALQNYEQALFFYQSVGDRTGQAYVYRAEGDVQKILGESGKTSEDYRESYRKALNLYHALGDQKGEASVRKAEPELSLFAVAHITLEEDNRAFVGEPYTVKAGISQDKQENFEGEPIDATLPGTVEPKFFEIMLLVSENIKLIAGRDKRLQYNPYDPKPQFVEFQFKVVESGEHTAALDVNFCHKQCLVRTFHIEFAVVAKPLVVGSEE